MAYLVAMASNTERAQYIRPDRQVAVRGFWNHRGGCLYLGEVTVTTATKVMRFSSTTPMTADGLAGYATEDYINRHASKFQPRREHFPA